MNLIRKNLYRNLQVILCHSIKLEASIANMHSGGLAAPVFISDTFLDENAATRRLNLNIFAATGSAGERRA
jgi:hypothetical protein